MIPGTAAGGESVPLYKTIWLSHVIHQMPVKTENKGLGLL